MTKVSLISSAALSPSWQSQPSLKNLFVTCAGLELLSHSLSCKYEGWSEQEFYHLCSDGDTWVSDELSIKLTSTRVTRALCCHSSLRSGSALWIMNMQTSLTERKSYGNSTPIPNYLPFLCPPVAVLMVCVHPETRGSFHFLQELQIPSCHQREFGLVTYLSPFSINSWLLHCSSLWNTLVKTGKWNENYKENLEN